MSISSYRAHLQILKVMKKDKTKRKYLPASLEISGWDSVKNWFNELLSRDINHLNELIQWLKDKSELESVLQEDLAWRYIQMNCNTKDETLARSFELFITEIEPKIKEFDFELNKKLCSSEFVDQLKDDAYCIMVRHVRNETDLFRSENIPIMAQLEQEEQEYGKIASRMTVNYQGKELTLQQAANFLKDTDRKVREEVYRLSWDRRMKDSDTLDHLLMNLIEKRQLIARNAGFENYRDYMFRKLGRFDYRVEDCLEFHESVKKNVVPIVEVLQRKRKERLGLDKLKPWDTDVDEFLRPPLKPFNTADELVSKTIDCFRSFSPQYATYIETMAKENYLDLESRIGKAPGGFNYPLHESNIPFIFMNATGNIRDLETMVHEGGHAVHSFLSKDLELSAFKETPSEIAELASMSMELISMEHWDVFFDHPDELKRARLDVLKGTIQVLPWVAMIDKFQHLLYTEENLNPEKWKDLWRGICAEFQGNVINHEGLEKYSDYLWQKQLHIFEVPFYYIEYGFAQLGAIAVWRNYRENPKKALQQYENALKLGYTKTIPEIYKTAGVAFDFSQAYIAELMQYVLSVMEKMDHG